MAIKNNITIDGLDISLLKRFSRKIVIKICDKCGDEAKVRWQDIMRSREKSIGKPDLCFKCAMENMRGDNNPTKRIEVRKKISQATKGKSKHFRDGVNPRIVKKRKTTNGYILLYDEIEQKYIAEHRKVVENSIGRSLLDEEKIHHIDYDKTNNSIENLCLCKNEKEHQAIHQDLARCAIELFKKSFVRFNKATNTYYIDPEIILRSMSKSYGFEEIAIAQKKNKCRSRLDVDITSEVFRGIYREIPLIAANMSLVTNAEFCISLYKLGALGVMHRANNIDVLKKEVEIIAKQCDIVCASIGVGNDQFDLCRDLIKSGANVIFVDVAHGYSDYVIDIGKKIKRTFPSVKLVLGNTTNLNMLYEISDFADALKVGIANGSVCETKNTAGCNEKQFSSIFKFRQLSKEFGIPIISDGGIKEPSDFTKAIGAGANSVMAGRIFAMCPESAAPIVEENGCIKKIYAGMASRFVQEKWRGGLKKGTCPEGRVDHLDLGESAQDLLERYSGALKSGITYSGADNIESFQKNAEFVIIRKG